jgi:hypothetical protein
MAEIPNTITPITATELASALVAAWRSLFGHVPSRRSILVLLAQSAHETAEWRAVHCFNIGNVKSIEGDGYDYTYFRCRERIDGRDVYLEPPHPATRFRAFRTLAEGTIDHLAFLKGRRRWARAWEAIERGSPAEFAVALKTAGYYTDPVEVYSRRLVAFYKLFDASLPAELVPPEVDAETAARAQGLVAMSLHRMAGVFVTGDPNGATCDDDAIATSDTEPAPPDDERKG